MLFYLWTAYIYELPEPRA